MGSFANTVFSVMLGWLQGLVSMVWSALTADNVPPFLLFFRNNWLIIVILLCAAGVIVDFAVYLFRWEPYKVWKTTWRHLRKQTGQTPEKVSEVQDEGPETFYLSSSGKKETDIPLVEEDELRRWRETESPEEEQNEHLIITKAGYSVPEDSPYRRPENQNRRRFRISNFFSDTGDETDYHYISPRPVIDRKEAYHAPVYPEKWEKRGEQDS